MCVDNLSFLVAQGVQARTFAAHNLVLVTRDYCNLCKDGDGASAGTLLVSHNYVPHGGKEDSHFTMERTRTFNNPFSRQIDQDKSTIVMNSGNEWMGDSIPIARFCAPGLKSRRKKS